MKVVFRAGEIFMDNYVVLEYQSLQLKGCYFQNWHVDMINTSSFLLLIEWSCGGFSLYYDLGCGYQLTLWLERREKQVQNLRWTFLYINR